MTHVPRSRPRPLRFPNAPSARAQVPLGLAVVAIGCSFEHGVAPGGRDNAYDVTCDCDPPPATVTYSLADDADDAEEDLATGEVNLSSSDLELAEDGGAPQLVGLRFATLGIPQGATVLEALLQFTADEATSGTTSLVIRAQAADDAAPFTGSDEDLSDRPLGAGSVAWAPPPWGAAGDAGSDQRTPDLAPLLQELVDRPGWTQASAAAFLIAGTGERVAVSRDASPADAARLVVTYQEEGVGYTIDVCVPELLNPNRAAGHAPGPGELDQDVADRVEPTLEGLAAACGYPSLCTCGAVPASEKFAAVCDQDCVGHVLTDCSEFDPVAGNTTATHAAGGTPVCTPGSPLASAIYGLRSRCAVSGLATIEVDGEDTKTPGAAGVIEFVGRPCPGGSCAVGVEVDLDLDDVTYSSLFGSATFRDLAAVAGGEVVVDGTGVGAATPGALAYGARGERDGDFGMSVGTNDQPVAVEVGWADPAPACALVGTLSGNVDPELARCEPAGPDAGAVCTSGDDCADDPACTDEVCDCLAVPETEQAMSLDVAGPLVNQPPSADAGPDAVVECNLPGGGTFELRSSSTDPDGNLALTRWTRDHRVGPEVGFAPRVRVVQDVATSATYVVRVIDADGQADEDAVQVDVADTTAPVLSCNAPATVTPGQHDLVFTATADDACDPTAAPVVTAFGCSKDGKPHPCKVSAAGATLTVTNPSGVGTRIAWELSATDASGNVGVASCAVDVATR